MKTDLPFAAVVVLYNVKCEESATCQSLIASAVPNLTVFVYDNSTLNLGNDTFCAERGWYYLGGDGNKGLSAAYNASIRKVKEEMKDGILCLFDDDTNFDVGYFTALQAESEKRPDVDIFLPLIFCKGTLISPCRLTDSYRQILFSSEREALDFQGDDVSAINSCMAVRLSVYDDFTYDENVFLDGVDHHFMKNMIKVKKRKFCIFPYRCRHSFSGMERPEKKAAQKRFAIFARDHAYWFRKTPSLYWRVVGKRALHLALTYRSVSFFRDFFYYRKHFGSINN